jgi:hypothetical protein
VIGGVALRVSAAGPSRIGVGGLNVGTDVDPIAGTMLSAVGAGGVIFARALATSGAAINFRYTGAAHTGQTAATETVDFDIRSTGVLQHATGALATQRTVRIQRRTYSFVAASTITNAATLAIENPPLAGTNATITNSYALWIQGGQSQFDGGIRTVRPLVTTGIPVTFEVTPGADTGLTASVEAVDIDFNLARTAQHATGALTTQRAMRVRNPTYSFVAASTITNAATVAIEGAPVAGTNATITTSMALWVQAGLTRFDGGVDCMRTAVASGVPITFEVSPGADTGLTAGAETVDVDLNLARIAQHATGAITTQRAMRVQAPTYSFVGASTITTAATVAIVGAPVAGTNATITRPLAFWVQAGDACFDGALSLGGSETPAVLAAGTTQDRALGVNVTAVRQTVNAAGSALGGLTGGVDGRHVEIYNISTGGAETLTLNHEDAGSTAANRFLCPAGAAVVVANRGCVVLRYDATDSRWRVKSVS